MADGLRSLRWRAAILLVGLGLTFAWVHFSGRTSYTLQIDYSWAREILEGAEVEIDGEVVGTLQRYGRSGYQTGFRVEAGDHVVRVLHDDCEGVPERVALGPSGARLVILMADWEDGYTCRVVLRGG